MKNRFFVAFALLALVEIFSAQHIQARYAGAKSDIRSHFLPPVFYTATDTIRIMSRINRGNELAWSQPQVALDLFRQAEQSSRICGYISGSIEALISTAHVYSGMGKFPESFAAY